MAADPLSVAGTAVGIVSLGLSLCQGLTDYLGALKCRKEDIQSATSQVEGLQAAFGAIQIALPKLSADSQASAAVVKHSLQSCEAELDKLNTLLEGFKKEAAPANGIGDKIKQQGQKLSYPFRQSNLRRIEEKVQILNTIMLTGLQAVLVDTNGAQLKSLSNATTLAKTISALVTAVADQSSKISTTVNGIRDDISSIDLSHVEKNVQQSMESQGRKIEHFETLLNDLRLADADKMARLNRMETEFRTLQRLISKPDVLRSFCDQTGPSSFSITPETIGNQRKRLSRQRGIQSEWLICVCAKRYSRRDRHYFSPSAITLFTSDELYENHLPECPYHTSPSRSLTIGAKISYIGRFLSKAITVTMCIKTGAGGISISPQLSFRGLARPDSPAFSLLSSETFLEAMRWGSEVQLRDTLRSTADQILQLFAQRQASPAELNEKGESLLHVAIENISFLGRPDILGSDCEELVSNLCASGVPIDVIDENGRSLLTLCVYYAEFNSPEEFSLMMEISSLLISRGLDLPLSSDSVFSHSVCPPWASTWRAGLIFISCCIKYDEFAELCQCGPLSMAILRQSQKDVSQILERSQDALKERTFFGQTPLHLSYNWPIGIQLLFYHGAQAIIDLTDEYATPAYTYASTLDSSDCLKLLLEADCCLFPSEPNKPEMRTTKAFDTALSRGCAEIGERIIESLSNRRARLTSLVMEKMMPNEAEEFIVNGTVRDGRSHDAYLSLIARGCIVPEALAGPTDGQSVYHTYHLSPQSAQALYNAGFHDVDLFNNDGLTPLMTLPPSSLEEIMGRSYWLLEHGAELRSKPKTDPGSKWNSHLTAAHFLATRLGREYSNFAYRHWCSTLDEAVDHLPTLLFSFSEADNCSCGCSRKGCTPATILFKVFFRCSKSIDGLNVKRSPVQWLVDHIPLTEDIWCGLSSSIMRSFTFEALELKHTCCKYKFWEEGSYELQLRDEEDITEIREEDRFNLQQLEKLVQEFETKFSQSTESLLEFLIGYWSGRMKEILEAVGSVDEADLKEIEEIGVVLDRRDEIVVVRSGNI